MVFSDRFDDEDMSDESFREMEARYLRMVPSNLTVEEAREIASSHQPTTKVLSTLPGPRVYLVENFLNEKEVAHLLSRALANLERDAFDTDQKDAGLSLEMPIEDDLVLRDIANRQYRWLGYENEEHGTMRVRRYDVGRFHPLHTDSYPIENRTLIASMLIYLNTPEEGGATFFPYHKMTVANAKRESKSMGKFKFDDPASYEDTLVVPPVPGNMLVWLSCNRKGDDDILSVHGSQPIKAGFKWTYANFIYNDVALCQHDPK